MKRFVIVLLVLCLAVGCVIGYIAARSGDKAVVAPAGQETPAETDAEAGAEMTAEPAEEPELRIGRIDYEAIRALHEPDEVVGNVDGRDITWDEYSYWICNIGAQAQDYIDMMAMYGQSLDWTDKLSAESEQTFAEYVMDLVNDSVREMCTVETVAGEVGAELSEEDLAEIAEQEQKDIVEACGEGAGEEDFAAFLEEKHISRDMYDELNRVNFLYRNGFKALYGEHGADVDDETALGYLKDNGYISAAHILLMTIDSQTREALDDETVAQKLAQAEELAAELRGIEDVETLLARFAELKEQYCEDTGKEKFPGGYLFTPGTMVAEFEDAVNALEEYQVSEPIKTSFGYHIIMRLPLSADMPVDFTDDGSALTARALYANSSYSELMTGRIEASILTLYGELKDFDLMDYIKYVPVG